LPYWLDAILADPESASQILSDFLELRRQMAAEIAVRARQEWSDHAARRVERAIDDLEGVADSGDLRAIVTADLAVFRALLGVNPQLAYATVFNAMERIMTEVPEVVQAMYADPESNVQGLRSFALLIASDETDDDVREIVAGMLEHFDRETLSNFVELLRSREPSGGAGG
jgi:DNA-binding FadR family transcriptional regulator